MNTSRALFGCGLMLLIGCGSVVDPASISPTVEDESAASGVPDLLPRSFAKTTVDLNLRSGPSTNYRVLTVMPAGARVEIMSRSDSWYAVRFEETSGWASGRYLEAVEATPPPDTTDPSTRWMPRPGTSWQWQITGTIDTSIDVSMYDIDLFDAPESTIARLHADGRKVICYFSAGSHEDFRSDAGQFPSSAIGRVLDDWPGERWLDVRDAGVRRIMQARMDLAVQKRCDGVEPDNVDGYANRSGFTLTARDQLDYNRFLANEAHARGLSVGLKNDLDQVDALAGDFDWALNEECVQYGECDALAPFIDADKAVFHVEYGGASTASRACAEGNARNFDTLVKRLDLDAWRIACR